VTSSASAIEPAGPADLDRIAELTVGVRTAGDLVSPGHVPEPAGVAGRASRAELLVARDGSGRVVGSVALVLSGDFGEVIESADEAAFGDADRRRRRPGPGPRRGAGANLPGPGPRGRQATDGALHRAADDRGAPALRAAGLHPAAGAGRTPVPGVDLWVYALEL
jgi:hypothetical protein